MNNYKVQRRNIKETHAELRLKSKPELALSAILHQLLNLG